MANHGKRMVKENLIATVATESDVQEVQNNLDAFKVKVIEVPKYEYTVRPTDVEQLSTFENGIPILKTNKFTDADTFGHPVIDVNKGDSIRFTGTFGIRDTSTSSTKYFTTINKNYFTDTAGSFTEFIVKRTGDNSYAIVESRCTGATSDSDNTMSVYKFTTTTYYYNTGCEANKNPGAVLLIRVDNAAPTNLTLNTPTTEGTYLLKCTVDSNSEVSAFS